MSALGGKISYGCPELLLGQKDIVARGEPQSTSEASDKDLWKSMNTFTFTCTVSQSFSWVKKAESVK
jgi:hypothetical protein